MRLQEKKTKNKGVKESVLERTLRWKIHVNFKLEAA